MTKLESRNRKRLTKVSFFFVTLIMAVSATLFSLAYQAYVLQKAEENITNLLLSHKGIHHYVQNTLLPAYAKYQQDNKIPSSFYAPELLSSSFIVRNQHVFYNQEREDAGYPVLYYKMAANNPRNPVNKADKLEKKLIRLFNDHQEIKSHKEIIEIDGKKMLYVAIPFLRNEAHCMRCHSRREDAPPELQQRYPGQGGFNERIGEIRAITSIRAPLENEYRHIFVFGLTIFMGGLAFVGLFFFNTRLRSKVEKKTVSLQREIEERKLTEKTLRKNRSMLQQILNTTPQSIFWKDIHGVYQGCNRLFAENAGLVSPEQVIGKTDQDLPWSQEETKAYRTADREVISSGQPKLHIVEPLQKADGQRIWIRTSKVPLKDENGVAYGVLGVFEDITRRKLAEEDLKIKESAIAESINAIILADLEGRLTYTNRAFLAFWGYTESDACLGRPFADFWQSQEQAQAVLQELKSKGSWLGEMRARKNGGEIFVAQVSSGLIQNDEGKPLSIMASFLDVTEKHRYEEQIRQSQRLESIGTLAGGIAHDFNNILLPILGYADMVLETLPQNSEAWSHQQAVITAGCRAKDLVQQILAFARQGTEGDRIPVQMSAVVNETLKLLRASIPSTIEIRRQVEENAGFVLANTTQIHQLIMNLCTNAYQAMQERGGVLTVSLKKAEIDINDMKIPGEKLSPGSYLLLEIGDTGSGMDPNTLGRIFEPYFTTKEKGKGTGLGLALVHGIVKSLGGAITAFSELNKGSVFTVYLPKLPSPDTSATATAGSALPRGNERILIVDDEEVIAQMLGKMLQSLGYEATALTSSGDAWDHFQCCSHDIDLIITDMTMPRMTGLELAQRIISLNPQARIILCTGFSELVTEQKAKSMGISEFIMKPIVKKDLAHAVRKVLDRH